MEPSPAARIVCVPYLAASECAAVRAQLDAATWEEGGVATDRPGAVSDGGVRRCAITQAIPPALIDRLSHDLRGINAQGYGFDCRGFVDHDPVTAMRYGVGDHFVWHIDNAVAETPSASRKLSFSLQLSEPAAYDGGDLEFAMYGEAYGDATFASQRADARAVGSLIVFPSFHVHRISAVTRGTRLAIVGWLHGPPFR